MSTETVHEAHADSFKTRQTLQLGDRGVNYFSLKTLESKFPEVARLPFSLRVMLENLLRTEDGKKVLRADIESLARWSATSKPEKEINFTPARVLLQDFTGVPAVVDLAVMRDAMVRMGGDPKKINPLQPADLVIDHSVQVDVFGSRLAVEKNAALEFERNQERYEFLRWGQKAFNNFNVVPPDTGIVHQVNLEYLASVAFSKGSNGSLTVYPDTVVGTDSHTTMINGLGVVGWGVGGIEAEAAMLGQPITLLIPQVVGFKLTGTLPAGATATDLVLTVTQMLRKKGVVGKFVEFYGAGLDKLPVADRATIANMAPEYGATIGFFPVDDETLRYLRFTHRSTALVQMVETYYKAQGLFRDAKSPEPIFSDTLELDLGIVEPSLAGPKRPQDRVSLHGAQRGFREALCNMVDAERRKNIEQAWMTKWLGEGGSADSGAGTGLPDTGPPPAGTSNPIYDHAHVKLEDGQEFRLTHGSVVIAAITSCTNTSNPSVMMAAGLLARKAVRLGLKSQPWVKTSLAPGSQVVTKYLEAAGVLNDLEALNFYVVGYGCTTCIGNSGPLPDMIAKGISDHKLVAVSVLSGNRNFEGRINPHVKANYLASPPLVVAYAIAGTMDIDLDRQPLGHGKDGKAVYLRDIWPTPQELEEAMAKGLQSSMFEKTYSEVFHGSSLWNQLPTPEGDRYVWNENSTYIKAAPYFDAMPAKPAALTNIHGARVLAVLGDSVTTDHISPAGSIAVESPAGKYLLEHGVEPKDFNSYGSRRGNHEVMVRGTFANIRLKNQLAPGTEGPWTVHFGADAGERQFVYIYDASVKYAEEKVPLVVLAGSEYGTGSSRDWAAKGPMLLGIRAVIAKSFERIHRSNLIGMGILPLQFDDGVDAGTLGLSGEEVYDIDGITEDFKPGKRLRVTTKAADGTKKTFDVTSRIDTLNEVDYYKHGGILHYVLRSLLS